MNLKAVIFDFDDTLTDNKKLDLESFRHLSRVLRLYMPTGCEIKELRKTLLAKDIISWMIRKSARSVPLDVCLKIRDDFLRNKNEQLIIIKPKIRSTLRRLKSRGCILFVATMRTDIRAVKTILRKYGLEKYFEEVYGKDFGDKTSIYKEILLDLDLRPHECMVVGDSFQDLLQALDLGMEAVGVFGSYGADPRLFGNVKVLKDLSALATYVKSHYD